MLCRPRCLNGCKHEVRKTFEIVALLILSANGNHFNEKFKFSLNQIKVYDCHFSISNKNNGHIIRHVPDWYALQRGRHIVPALSVRPYFRQAPCPAYNFKTMGFK